MSVTLLNSSYVGQNFFTSRQDRHENQFLSGYITLGSYFQNITQKIRDPRARVSSRFDE